MKKVIFKITIFKKWRKPNMQRVIIRNNKITKINNNKTF